MPATLTRSTACYPCRMELSGIELTVALVAVAAGALVQGSIGFGFVLVAAPVVGLMEPDALPATFLWLAFPLALWMVIREHSSVDWPGFTQLTIGRVLGTAVAGYVIATIAADTLAVAVGIAIVCAALISAFASGIEVGTKGRLGAGVVSGVMGTIGAVGGPASALAYQKREGAEIRATLAASFVIGLVLSMAALALAGRMERWHFDLAVVLFPGLVVGLFVSSTVIRKLDARWIRPVVLVCAGLGGIAIALKGL